MPTFNFDQLAEIGTRIFEAAGAPINEAQMTARLLATANLVGHDSHGVIRISQYLGFMEIGDLIPGAPIEIIRETSASAVINGNWGFGQVIASKAMEVAIEKAKNVAVSCVTVQRCNHIGRLADYALMATPHEMIAMIVANNHGAGRNVAAWGGRSRRISTNPLCVAIPRGEHMPILTDITSSIVAEGKVRLMRNRGGQVPEGWIMDAEGNPSTDAKDFYDEPRGTILPLGGMVGHKGYALSAVIDMLSGGLSGGGCSREGVTQVGNATLITVYNISSFVPIEEFYQEMNDFVEYVKSSELAPGFEEALVPGEPEARIEAKRRAEGIFVEEETWRQLLASAEKVGTQLEDFRT
jgi:uncharacterized oxidoreductase